VWYGTPDSGSGLHYPVQQAIDPAFGSYATTDGDVSGQHAGNFVAMQNGCFKVTDPHYGTYTVCKGGEVSHNSRICYFGDSGGPVYVRQSNGKVLAAGTIIAIDTTKGQAGYQCYFQELAYALGTANLKLDTAG
jgi:hypothetical protein